MLLPLAAGCLTQVGADGPEDTDAVADPDSAAVDTAPTWEPDTDAGIGDDTFRVVDHPIGATALDGDWSGTFTLTAAAIGSTNGVAAGEVTFTIDGDGERHVVARFHADTWDPQVSGLARPYGPVDGIGFATLDPGDLTEFRLDVGLAARNMATFSREGVRVKRVDDQLVINFSNIIGVGPLRVGHKLVVEATRAGGEP